MDLSSFDTSNVFMISYTRSGFNKAENFVKPDGITGLEYYGTSLMLGVGTSPRHYFQLTDGTIDDFMFTVDGKAVTAVQKDDTGLYYITARDHSSAKDLYTPSVIQVTRMDDPSQSMMFSYSAMDYVTRGLELNSFDEKGKKFATALGWFADAAKAYFDLV